MSFTSEPEICPVRVAPQESPQALQFTEIFKPGDGAPEKTEGQRKLREAEVQIADILLRNDDFNSGVKRERVMTFFSEALSKSPKEFTELVGRINAELKKRGSSLQIEAQCEQKERIEVVTFPPTAEAVERRPIRFKVTENVGALKVVSRFGEIEDKAQVTVLVNSEQCEPGAFPKLTSTVPLKHKPDVSK